MWAEPTKAAEDAGEKVVAVAAKGLEATAGGAVQTAAAVTEVGSAATVVGGVLASAFAVGVVFMFVEALTVGISALKDWEGETHKLNLAQDEFKTKILDTFQSLDEQILKAEIRLDELRGDHLAALKKQLELINMQSLDQLEGEFTKLGKAADAVLSQLKVHWYQIDLGSSGAGNALKDFTTQYELLLAEGKKKEASDLLAGTLDSAKKALATMQDLRKEADMASKASGGMGGTAQGGPGERELRAQQTLVDALNAQIVAQQKIETLGKDNTLIKQQEEQNREVKDAEKSAKAAEKAERERHKAANEAMKEGLGLMKQMADAEKKRGETAKLESGFIDNALKKEMQERKDSLQTEAEFQKQKLIGMKAEVDGEIEARKAATDRDASLLKLQLDTRVITEKQYQERIKDLYNQETKDLNAMLSKKQQLVIIEAQAEWAARGKILTAEEAKELKGYIDLENQKRKIIDANLKVIDKDIQNSAKIAQKSKPSWDKYFDGIIDGSLRAGQALKMLKDLTIESIGESVAAAISGSMSFGEAMQKMLKDELTMLAGKATVKALEEVAYAFASLAVGDGAGATKHFLAAAKWGAVAAASGFAAHAIPSPGGSGGSNTESGKGPSIDGAASQNQTSQNAVTVTNAPHLATGGIFTRQTALIVGDGARGGDAAEGVIPLKDPRALQMIAGALGPYLQGSGDIHVHAKGDLIDLGQVCRKISRGVERGSVRLKSTDSRRLTRRS